MKDDEGDLHPPKPCVCLSDASATHNYTVYIQFVSCPTVSALPWGCRSAVCCQRWGCRSWFWRLREVSPNCPAVCGRTLPVDLHICGGEYITCDGGVYHMWWGIYHRGRHTETSDSAPIWPPHRLFIILSTHITMNMHAHTYKRANHSQTVHRHTHAQTHMHKHTCTNPHAHTRTCLYGIEWDIDDKIVDTGLGRADLEPQKDREWELHSVNAKKQLLHFLTCSM